METSRADESQTSLGTTDASVDVEMEVSASILKKPDHSSKKKKKKNKSNDSNSANTRAKAKTKRDPNKPEYPKTGYVRYVNKRRAELKTQFPNMDALDITKKMGEEWMVMDDEKKNPYLEAAEKDFKIFKLQMKKYNEKLKKEKIPEEQVGNHLSTESVSHRPKKSIKKKIASKTVQMTNGTSTPTKPPPISNNMKNDLSADRSAPSPTMMINTPPPTPPHPECIPIHGEIPIFTDQFLDHNRQLESELKKLRKLNTDYEQQNSVLDKHVENVQNGIAKMSGEIDDLMAENEKIRTYLNGLRRKLADNLGGLVIPNQPNGATVENIDNYMNDLYEMAKNNSHGPASLNKAKDILRKIDLKLE